MTTRRDFPSMRVCTIHAFAPDRWTAQPEAGQRPVGGRKGTIGASVVPAVGPWSAVGYDIQTGDPPKLGLVCGDQR